MYAGVRMEMNERPQHNPYIDWFNDTAKRYELAHNTTQFTSAFPNLWFAKLFQVGRDDISGKPRSLSRP